MPNSELYTPGYTQNASDFMAQRSARAEVKALREWSRDPDAIFAQAWCEILGTRNG